MKRQLLLACLALPLGLAAPVTGSAATQCDGAAAVGTGGTATAGDTSASTLGTAGVCDTGSGQSASIAAGGSAAAPGGKAQSRTHTTANSQGLSANTKAQAMDKGTFSKSMTKTKEKHGTVDSRTRTMAHVPGQKPVITTTGQSETAAGG